MEPIMKSERFSTFQVLGLISTVLERDICYTFRSINASLSRCAQSCLSEKTPAQKDLRNPEANLALTEHRSERRGLLFLTCSVEALRWNGPVPSRRSTHPVHIRAMVQMDGGRFHPPWRLLLPRDVSQICTLWSESS